MVLLTALLTSAAVTSLVTWNGVTDSQTTTAVGSRAYDFTTSPDVQSPPTGNDTDFRSPMTSEGDFRSVLPTTTAGYRREQRAVITRSIRLYGIVVAACVATVLAVALAAACVMTGGGGGGSRSSAVRWTSPWFRRLRCRRSAAAHDSAAATSGAGDSDYIYRPLGTGTGSRLDDEYETTFVGVSVPLLHDVRAV